MQAIKINVHLIKTVNPRPGRGQWVIHVHVVVRWSVCYFQSGCHSTAFTDYYSVDGPNYTFA